MKVSAKVSWVLLAVVSLALLGLGLGLKEVLTERFTTLENREIGLSVGRMEEILSELMSGPASKITDWANWDDTHKYILDRNKTYEEANFIPATLDNLGVDSLRFFDFDLKPVFQLDREGSEELSSSLTPHLTFLFSDRKAQKPHKGFLVLGDRLAVYAALPIRPGSGEGDPAGQMLMLRFVSQPFLERASELFKLPIRLESPSFSVPEITAKIQPRSQSFQSGVTGIEKSLSVIEDNEKVQIWSQVGSQGQGSRVFSASLPRPIFAEASRTIRTVLLACLGAFAAAFVALMISLRTFVVGRLVSLEKQIGGLAKSESGRVDSSGTDEIASVARALNSTLSDLEEKKAAVQRIVENVKSGFVRVDREGIILPGYTKFFETLLEKNQLEGQKLSSLLMLAQRDVQNFDWLFAQLIDDVFPEETNVSQIPRQCVLGKTWISIRCVPLREPLGSIESVLFTLNDITEQRLAEREALEATALIKILQSKTVFQQFIADLPHAFEQLRGLISDAEKSSESRRLLHTLKGNFSMFGLGHIARVIHQVEDLQIVTSAHVDRVESLIREFLAQRIGVLGIEYGNISTQGLVVSDMEVKDFIESSSLWKTLLQGQKELRDFFDRMRFVTAQEVLSVTAEAGRVLCERLGKKAEIIIVGGGVRLDQDRLRGVLDALINAVRNAVDHGLELPEDRGTKPAKATLVLGVFLVQDRLSFYVEDDGRGIDWKSLKEVILKKGLCSEEFFDSAPEQQRLEFLFADNVTTVESPTEISGRGLGMGALRDAARALGGDLALFSQPDAGTRVEVWVPAKAKRGR